MLGIRRPSIRRVVAFCARPLVRVVKPLAFYAVVPAALSLIVALAFLPHAEDSGMARRLENEFQSMLPCFEDKETEQNWQVREQSLQTIRKITHSSAPSRYPTQYFAGIKLLQNGIIKSIKSLRTSLTTNGCITVQDLAKVLGPALDQCVDVYLETAIELCGHTKTQDRQNGNKTVIAIITNVTLNTSIILHISKAGEHRTVAPRVFAAEWLQIIVKKHGRHCEHGGGVDIIDRAIRRGLKDAKQEVRDSMRSTYWVFAVVWPQRAAALMLVLDKKSQKQLEYDSSNPNKLTAAPVEAVENSKTDARKTVRELKADAQRRKQAEERPIKEATETPSENLIPPLTHPVMSSSTLHVKAKRGVAVYQRRPLLVTQRQPSLPEHVTLNPIVEDHMVVAPISEEPFSCVTKESLSVTSNPGDPEAMTLVVRKPAPIAAVDEQVRLASVVGGSAAVTAVTENTELVSVVEEHVDVVPIVESSLAVVLAAKNSEPLAVTEEPLSAGPVTQHPMSVAPGIEEQVEVAPFVEESIALAPVAEKSELLALTEEPTVVRPVLEETAPMTTVVEDHPVVAPSVQNSAQVHDFNESAAVTNVSEDHMAVASIGQVSISDLLYEEQALWTTAFADQMAIAPINHESIPSSVVEDDIPLNTMVTNPMIVASVSQKSTLTTIDEEPGTRPIKELQAKPVKSIHGDENTTATGSRWSSFEIAERNHSIPPMTSDPEVARRLMARAIANIRNKTMDELGYRKLQGLIHYHDQLFHDEGKYDEMLLALIDALESPNDEARTPLGRKLDHKFRILVIIRLMNIHNHKYYAAYYPRLMSALITARTNFDAKSHIVSGIELTARDIIQDCSPPDLIDSVLDHLEFIDGEHEDRRSLCMGLFVLGALATRMRNEKTPLTSARELRMAKLGLRCLMKQSTEVRIGVVAFCVELNDFIRPADRFFGLVCENNHELSALLTYYIKKNRR